METKTAKRKSFDVEYVVVTDENIEEVAAWCNGKIEGEGNERCVKIIDKNAISTRQAKAFIDDYMLKMSATGNSFKAFTKKAFLKSFEPMNTDPSETSFDQVVEHAEPRQVSRSAQTGQFVSKDEAEKHPDVTVTETVQIPVKEKVKLEGTSDFDGDTQVRVEDLRGL